MPLIFIARFNLFYLTSFQQLGLPEPIQRAIAELGFEQPTEIQAQAIPQLLDDEQDFIGLAQTGTGKTAAFGLPLLAQIDPSDRSTQGLILAPTRELGIQIADQLESFSKYMDRVNVLAVYGGTNITTQIKALRSPQQVVIATPGRLMDLIRRKAIRLEDVRYVILDEADEMLNMGFKEEVDRILSYTPPERAIWLFSATMSADINQIVRTYMADPAEVRLTSRQEVNSNIEHQYVIVTRANKPKALSRFLDIHPQMRGVVFCRTRRDTQELAEKLVRKGYKADALHGDLSQRQRDAVMRKFRNHDLQILVATDVAARGIDVNDLTHVFHYSLPDDLPYYTHRSGRTARAGKKGTSIAFINGREKNKIRQITRALDISFEQVEIPTVVDVFAARTESWARDILDTRTNGKLDPKLIEKANLLFGNLSKEELTAKLLMYELDKLHVHGSNDLNDSQSYERHGHGNKPRNQNGQKRKPRHSSRSRKHNKKKQRS